MSLVKFRRRRPFGSLITQDFFDIDDFFDNRMWGLDLDLWGLKNDGSQFPLEISLSPSKINGKQLVITFSVDNTD